MRSSLTTSARAKNRGPEEQTHLDAIDSKQENCGDPLFEELFSWYELELDPEANAKRIIAAKKLLGLPRKSIDEKQENDQ